MTAFFEPAPVAGSVFLEAAWRDWAFAIAGAVADYWARLQQREAFQRALAVEREAALAQGVSPEPAMAVGGAA